MAEAQAEAQADKQPVASAELRTAGKAKVPLHLSLLFCGSGSLSV